MRHRKRGRRLNRNAAHRTALGRNLMTALFTHGRIVTTVPKAKHYRPAAEKLITLARRAYRFKEAGKQASYVHCLRRAIALLGSKPAVKTLFDEIGPAYEADDRPGGYTRIVRDARNRLGDNAPVAIWELVRVSAAPATGE